MRSGLKIKYLGIHITSRNIDLYKHNFGTQTTSVLRTEYRFTDYVYSLALL